jgi:hypothetical protein
MANTYLSRTFGTPTNASKFTISVWVKRGTLGAANILMFANGGNAQNFSNLMFTGDSLFWHVLNSNSEVSKIKSSAIYRDTSGWYHVVFNWDSTQSTASNRTKMYVNGVQLDSFSTQTNSAQNTNYHINTAVEHIIGAEKGNTGGSVGNYFDGSMSHYHFIDGTAYDATAFGEYDANGVWKIKTSPSVTYGTNGFFILKNGNSVTDQSPNTNNFTVGGGTLTNTEDNPSNVFATFNPLWKTTAFTPVYAYGNTEVTENQNGFSISTTTLGMSAGKFYCEAKYLESQEGYIGVIAGSRLDAIQNVGETNMGAYNNSWGLYPNGNLYNNNGTGTGFSGTSYTTNDIIQVALDMDNKKVYWGKNGTWMNSGVPTSGSTGTGAITVTDDVYFFGVSVNYNSITNGYGGFQYNFGNGYFGTTAVSSAGTNASGIGIFEYDVPTGYTALSTKGLNL